jgi:hypothetical protein
VAASNFAEVVRRTAGLLRDPAALELVHEQGLTLAAVGWEDTGRFKASWAGPNISDLTIQVGAGASGGEATCLPIIRFPNFEDRTADIPLVRFRVLVGNARGLPLTALPLQEVLGNLKAHLHHPDSWESDGSSLLAEGRDRHVLVSAQACLLPVPPGGSVSFNPVLFNYFSRQGDPAVLTILATREGTSVTVIDNVRDAATAGDARGQKLFFNNDGRRASLTGQRRSDHGGQPVTAAATGLPAPAELGVVLVIQVPLRQKELAPGDSGGEIEWRVESGSPQSDLEEAVIGHGADEGPFVEIDGLDVQRDVRFPIRVTVQFYLATSTGVLSPADVQHIAQQIERVYRDADFTGSLVVGGPTGRPTEAGL